MQSDPHLQLIPVALQTRIQLWADSTHHWHSTALEPTRCASVTEDVLSISFSKYTKERPPSFLDSPYTWITDASWVYTPSSVRLNCCKSLIPLYFGSSRGHSSCLPSPPGHVSTHFLDKIGVAGFDVHGDDSCHGCFKGCRREGSSMSSSKTPINEARGLVANGEGERGGQESCEPASLGPRTLLFVPPPLGLLLCSDHRHLKNNLMHGCSPLPPLSFSTVLAFFFPLSGTVPFVAVCREEWGMEDRKEAEGSQGGEGGKRPGLRLEC